MSHDEPESGRDQQLSSRCDRACAALIEERWRRAHGLALRIGRGMPGVVERPGRTRFDLEWLPAERSFRGPLRARWPWLPLVDGSFGLVILDRLAIADETSCTQLLEEAVRVLADDGRLLVVDTDPWGWIGLRARLSGKRGALSAGCQRNLMLRAGLEEVEIQGALNWPPLPQRVIERHGDLIDRLGSRAWPFPASLYTVCGRKRSSNVIAIPLTHDRRHGLVAAPEGMRRAG